MTTNIVTSSIPTTDSSTTSSSTTTSTSSTTLGQEEFLTLLTTQLQYQNPLDPQDPSEFVAQLAQFSSLEQLINVNTKLDDFATTVQSLQNSQNVAQGVSLLGKTIKAQGNIFKVTSGDAGELSYILGGAASQVKVSIYNSAGTLVQTLDMGSQSSGENQVSWDGKDANGNQVADGTYSYKVSATDSSGATVSAATLVSGVVEEVLQDSGTVYLVVNGRYTTLDNVLAVEQSS